jgi:pimeloyl-ACP methyl ester carboxylesterase
VGERIVKVSGVDICTETFGDLSDPPLLLIMGAMASMLWWPEGLYRQLAANHRLVIRYDQRDTGRSVTYEPGKPAYTLDGMTGDAAAVIEFMMGGWRLLSGSAHPFDEPSIRPIANREVKRATNLISMFSHARLTGGEQCYGKIGEIRFPALVIHGTEDPVLPYQHGLALSRAIPGAKLVTLRGTGHELHPADWNTIVGAVLEHTEPR